MSLLRPLSVACLAATLCSSVALAGTEARVTGAEAFEKLKGLAGTWSAEVPGVPAPVTVDWKVTAGGHAVMETLFVGSPHEMVSVYTLTGGELKLTHYCAAGNQPRMKLDLKRSTPAELVFAFDGGDGFDPKKDFHIHEGRIHFEEAGVRAQWMGWSEGKQADVKEFRLVSTKG